jgi:hypothetical protein
VPPECRDNASPFAAPAIFGREEDETPAPFLKIAGNHRKSFEFSGVPQRRFGGVSSDDCNICVRSHRASVLADIEQFLAKRFKLKVDKAQSAVAAPRQRKVPIWADIKRRLAPQTVAPFAPDPRQEARIHHSRCDRIQRGQNLTFWL